MKVWIPVTPFFNVVVSIDKDSSILNPIMQGSAPTVDTVVPNDFVLTMTGNENEPNKLSSMTSATASPYSKIIFNVVVGSIPTQVGSSLRIFTCENLIRAPSWSNTGSCIVGGTPRACTIATNDTITLITINSGSSNNYFAMGSTVAV